LCRPDQTEGRGDFGLRVQLKTETAAGETSYGASEMTNKRKKQLPQLCGNEHEQPMKWGKGPPLAVRVEGEIASVAFATACDQHMEELPEKSDLVRRSKFELCETWMPDGRKHIQLVVERPDHEHADEMCADLFDHIGDFTDADTGVMVVMATPTEPDEKPPLVTRDFHHKPANALH